MERAGPPDVFTRSFVAVRTNRASPRKKLDPCRLNVPPDKEAVTPKLTRYHALSGRDQGEPGHVRRPPIVPSAFGRVLNKERTE